MAQPNFWSSTDKARWIKLSDRNLTAQQRQDATSNGSVRAAHPIPPDGNYYFEIKWKKGIDVSIGLTPAGSPLDK